MKLFLAVLTIALVAQVSFAASIQRSKREVDDKPNGLEVLREGLKTMISRLETVASEMPDTDAYTKYRNDFEDIATTYHTKTRNEFCVQKVGKIFERLHDLIVDLEKDESEEAKKILEIFLKYKSDKFADDFENAVAAAKDPTVLELLNYC